MKFRRHATDKFTNQLPFIILIPLFFLIFVIVYSPFHIDESIIGNPGGHYQFNIVMIMCILLVVLGISRTLLFLFRRHLAEERNRYLLWMIGEFLTICLFTALYVTLMTRGALSYFNALLYSALYLLPILIFPYVFLLMLQQLSAANSSRAAILDDSSSRIRFYDDKHTLKFVISAQAILYIEAQENYVRIYYLDADLLKSYQLRATMKRIEESMNSNGLVRCHRSYFVNPRHIHSLRRDKDNYYFAEMDDFAHTSIPISKKYYESVSERL